jgi:predicted phosphoribosyltransferase
MNPGAGRVIELPELRNRGQVFRDRAHAGEVLAGMLAEYRGSGALVLGIAAGGVPVAAALARTLGLALDVAVVSKVTLPWNTEMGYGAVAFDGTMRLNEDMVARLGLGPVEVEKGIARMREKVRDRVQRFRAGRPLDVAGRVAIVVDDGLASGFTLLTAVAAVRNGQPSRLIVAVPTGHGESAQRIAGEVDALYCANVRTSPAFAVADAYEQWSDVSEDEALALLRTAQQPH